jgi:hypothetical protein
MATTPEQRAANAFVRGVKTLQRSWRQQTLSELRESVLDQPTRRVLAGLASGCDGLLEDHPAQWPLAALISLAPGVPEFPTTSDDRRGTPPSGTEPVAKEQVADWVDAVCDALIYLYGSDGPEASEQPRTPTVTVSLPRTRRPNRSAGKRPSADPTGER